MDVLTSIRNGCLAASTSSVFRRLANGSHHHHPLACNPLETLGFYELLREICDILEPNRSTMTGMDIAIGWAILTSSGIPDVNLASR